MNSSTWLSSPPHSRLQPLYPFDPLATADDSPARAELDELLEASRLERPKPASVYDAELQAGWWSALFN